MKVKNEMLWLINKQEKRIHKLVDSKSFSKFKIDSQIVVLNKNIAFCKCNCNEYLEKAPFLCQHILKAIEFEGNLNNIYDIGTSYSLQNTIDCKKYIIRSDILEKRDKFYEVIIPSIKAIEEKHYPRCSCNGFKKLYHICDHISSVPEGKAFIANNSSKFKIEGTIHFLIPIRNKKTSETNEFERFRVYSHLNISEFYKIKVFKDERSPICSCEIGQNDKVCRHIREFRPELKLNEDVPLFYRILNTPIVLKLENGKTNIYVNNSLFNHCKYVPLYIPLKNKNIKYEDTKNKLEEIVEVNSVDEAMEQYDKSQETDDDYEGISSKTIFFVHCSNLEAWALFDYDTRCLHSNLSFPLLKQLADTGDKKAKQKFKDEIFKRFQYGYKPTIDAIIGYGYLNEFTDEEKALLFEVAGLNKRSGEKLP